MTREEFYEELQLGIVERFQQLSEEDQNVVRKNGDSEYARVMRKFLGKEILDGLPRLRSMEEQKEYLKSTV